ncbi:MAG: noncanonical pyrimidine nucleotidase, YjjG family [Bacteroidota bacterium]|nr:MAG: noncanonical pyrimidine nucleotidase, YjjG family [Bacteroidota bacterium]
MKHYKHIFFDLDRTLWDFDSNSAQTLLEILDTFGLNTVVKDKQKWISDYQRHNLYVWKLYEKREITKTELRIERFRLLFDDFGISNQSLMNDVSDYYSLIAPTKAMLMPNAVEVLAYLRPHYKLYILSNGFYKVQLQKMEASGIIDFFENVFTSDRLGVAKPDRRIFEESIKSSNARKDQSIFVGENFETDIRGAKLFGIDQVWYNHDQVKTEDVPTFEIDNLLELKTILKV